jgi:hypothetical protein
MFADQLLGLGKALPQCCHSQLIVFDPQNDGIAGSYAERAPERRRDYNPSVLVNRSVTLRVFHDIVYIMTYWLDMSITKKLTSRRDAHRIVGPKALTSIQHL